MTSYLAKSWNTQRINFRLCPKTKQYPGTGVRKIRPIPWSFPLLCWLPHFFSRILTTWWSPPRGNRGAAWLSRSFPARWISHGADNSVAEGGFGVLYSWTWVFPREYGCGRPVAPCGIRIPPRRLLVCVGLWPWLSHSPLTPAPVPGPPSWSVSALQATGCAQALGGLCLLAQLLPGLRLLN